MNTPDVLKKMARLVILVLLTVVLPMSWCIPAKAASPETEMTRVRRSGDWQRIKTTANRLLERHPDNVYCLSTLVEANLQLKRYDDARATLIRLKRDYASQQYYLWALLEFLIGNYKEADKYAVSMLNNGAHDPVELRLSENIAYRVDRKRWMRLCAKHYKLDHASWYFSGGTTGDHSKAISEIMALNKDREHAPLNFDEFLIALISPVPKTKLTVDEKFLMATAHWRLDHEAAALDWCEPVALVKPKETITVLNALAGGSGFKSHARVRPLLEKLEVACRNDQEYWYIRSIQSWKQGRLNEALKYCERSIALNSNENNLWLRFNIDREAASTKTSQDAQSRLLSDLEPLVRKYPSIRSYTERVKVLHEEERFESEVLDLAHLIDLLPPGTAKLDARLRKAELEYTLGDLRAAKKTAEYIIQVQPDNPRAILLTDKIKKEMKRASMKD